MFNGRTLPFLQYLGGALIAIGAGGIGVAIGRRKRTGSATQG